MHELDVERSKAFIESIKLAQENGDVPTITNDLRS